MFARHHRPGWTQWGNQAPTIENIESMPKPIEFGWQDLTKEEVEEEAQMSLIEAS
jgi:N6-adenosine-specific RNA methylase IME4